ncbi:hypothetical protein F4813DRAFT_400237 [Daldinia decipiens]|uniref:uncharacterized protein n=1 Tax=Daldinia decipiens TaxID=326647 RepID=UPI0020C4D35C|nr:uncharacterized protein F4813DRAFT_400237 [Daldinia decipiens]KAI1653204.1 hypothetical protein F4813DRAFT_400237 [Daldinia decipiens]
MSNSVRLEDKVTPELTEGGYYMEMMRDRSEEEQEAILAEARERDLDRPLPFYEYDTFPRREVHLDTTPEELLSPEILAMPFGDVLDNYSQLNGTVQAHIRFFFRQKLGILEEHTRQVLQGTAGSCEPLVLGRIDASECTQTRESEVGGIKQLKDKVKLKASTKVPASVLKKRGTFVGSVLCKLHGI